MARSRARSPAAPINYYYQPNKKQDEKHPKPSRLPASGVGAARAGRPSRACAPPCNHRSPRRDDVDPLARDATVRLRSDADTAAVLRTLRIDEVGISGSQTAPTRNVQSQTPLFDRKAQAAAPVQTLESALRLAPSVDIRERGGKGMQADIFIRGRLFRPDHGPSQRHRLHRRPHRAPVPLAARSIIDCISAVDLLDGVPGVGAYAGAVNIRTAPLRPHLPAFRGAPAASTATPMPTFRAP